MNLTRKGKMYISVLATSVLFVLQVVLHLTSITLYSFPLSIMIDVYQNHGADATVLGFVLILFIFFLMISIGIIFSAFANKSVVRVLMGAVGGLFAYFIVNIGNGLSEGIAVFCLAVMAYAVVSSFVGATLWSEHDTSSLLRRWRTLLQPAVASL